MISGPGGSGSGPGTCGSSGLGSGRGGCGSGSCIAVFLLLTKSGSAAFHGRPVSLLPGARGSRLGPAARRDLPDEHDLLRELGPHVRRKIVLDPLEISTEFVRGSVHFSTIAPRDQRADLLDSMSNKIGSQSRNVFHRRLALALGKLPTNRHAARNYAVSGT